MTTKADQQAGEGVGSEMADSFSQAVKTAAERSVLKIISEGQWIAPDYANRFKLPAEFMAEVWKLVDADKLRAALAVRLEQEVADRIVNHLAAEIATDIKQLLSVKERREALRALARQHIDSVMNAGAAS
jgi:Mg/Co/Ni transporter MgtE